jgi:hypothetical protein
MSRRLISALITTVALSGTPMLSSAQIIDTRPPGLEFFWSGFSSGVMLGQSFSTPDAINTYLTTFTQYDVKVGTGEPLTYHAFIDVWNPVTRTTGAQVWSTSGNNLSTSYTDLNFAVNTQLTAGTQYLYVLFADAANGHFYMGATPYAGGGFYYQNGATPNNAWSAQWSAFDLEFSADFTSPVPEPDSMILFGSGLMFLVGVGVVRRQSIV